MLQFLFNAQLSVQKNMENAVPSMQLELALYYSFYI